MKNNNVNKIMFSLIGGSTGGLVFSALTFKKHPKVSAISYVAATSGLLACSGLLVVRSGELLSEAIDIYNSVI